MEKYKSLTKLLLKSVFKTEKSLYNFQDYLEDYDGIIQVHTELEPIILVKDIAKIFEITTEVEWSILSDEMD